LGYDRPQTSNVAGPNRTYKAAKTTVHERTMEIDDGFYNDAGSEKVKSHPVCRAIPCSTERAAARDRPKFLVSGWAVAGLVGLV
jgi:hypothetical protein